MNNGAVENPVRFVSSLSGGPTSTTATTPTTSYSNSQSHSTTHTNNPFFLSAKLFQRFQGLTASPSRETIQSLARWIIFHRNHPHISSSLLQLFHSNSNAMTTLSRPLIYFNVLHEILITDSSIAMGGGNPMTWEKYRDFRTWMGESLIVPTLQSIRQKKSNSYSEEEKDVFWKKIQAMSEIWKEVDSFSSLTLFDDVQREIVLYWKKDPMVVIKEKEEEDTAFENEENQDENEDEYQEEKEDETENQDTMIPQEDVPRNFVNEEDTYENHSIPRKDDFMETLVITETFPNPIEAPSLDEDHMMYTQDMLHLQPMEEPTLISTKLEPDDSFMVMMMNDIFSSEQDEQEEEVLPTPFQSTTAKNDAVEIMQDIPNIMEELTDPITNKEHDTDRNQHCHDDTKNEEEDRKNIQENILPDRDHTASSSPISISPTNIRSDTGPVVDEKDPDTTISYDFDNIVPTGPIDFYEIDIPSKAIATMQITRDLHSDSTFRLSNIFSSIPQSVYDSCETLSSQNSSQNNNAGDTKNETVSSDSMISDVILPQISDAVLDIDVDSALAQIRLYKEIVSKQKEARLKCIELLIKSQCEIGFSAKDAAKLFYSLDNKLETLGKRKEKIRDAMELEGLDFEGVHDETGGNHRAEEDHKIQEFDWYSRTEALFGIE